MTSSGTICKLRDLVADIDRGRAAAPLSNPLLREALRTALANYTDNMGEWARLSRLLESIERSIEWDGPSRCWVLCAHRTAEFHSALASLRHLCGGLA